MRLIDADELLGSISKQERWKNEKVIDAINSHMSIYWFMSVYWSPMCLLYKYHNRKIDYRRIDYRKNNYRSDKYICVDNEVGA